MRRLATALVTVLAITGGAGAIERKGETSAAVSLDPALWPALGLDRPASKMAAPLIKGMDLGGAPVSLASFRGRVVMLYFWATW